MAMGVRSNSSYYYSLLLLLLLSAYYIVSFSPVCHGVQVLSSSSRSVLGQNKNNNQIPNCKEIASRSQCLHNTKCRWCRSDAIDDMCFSSTEAWRLPQQFGLKEYEWKLR